TTHASDGTTADTVPTTQQASATACLPSAQATPPAANAPTVTARNARSRQRVPPPAEGPLTTPRASATGSGVRQGRAGPPAGTTGRAARAVAPVAIPSSTTTAVRPATGSRARPPR